MQGWPGLAKFPTPVPSCRGLHGLTRGQISEFPKHWAELAPGLGVFSQEWGWSWNGEQGWGLFCCKPRFLTPVTACTRHWASLLRAQAFQGSHLCKISKLPMAVLPPYSAALHSCLPCPQQALAASWKIPRSGVPVKVWHLQCLRGVSSMGGGKCSKHWGKEYFCALPFQVAQNLQLSAAIACYSESGMPIWDWGRGPFLSWSICFSSWKDNFSFFEITIAD